MNTRINFLREENCVIFITSLTSDQLVGDFHVIGSGFSHPFDGLIMKLSERHYHVAFSINWNSNNNVSYTTFTGNLLFMESGAPCILELSWLHVEKDEEAIHSLNGFSRVSANYTLQ